MVREIIKKDFQFLEKDVLGVLIYGSYAKKETTPRSDIDICIVIGSLSSPGEMRKLLSIVWRNVNINKKNYDVKIFEELPLHIKIEVIEDGKVIIGKKPEIYEYFYKFRKMWNDQKHRQKL
ncbi:MAG: nucleotidyltransferase domain-containing protein [Candidatus Aenigmarchaeota archaeon]|nr:nucleotidyltransferase domain-containing protein [Candidatus Aenigmarchaeota archaeon]